MSVFVGLDCGGSSCRVLALDEGGQVLFQGQAGATNLVSTPENRLRHNLASASRGCPTPNRVCGCFAGLINEETRRRAESMLTHLFPDSIVRAEPDYAAAFYASDLDTDLLVIAGTGSLVCSRNGDALVKSGGRGYLLGDEGSGFHYGRDALISFLDAPEVASSQLRSEIVRLFGTTNEAELVASVYRAQPPSPILAKLVKALGQDANRDVDYAIQSIERNTARLMQVVIRHINQHLAASARLKVSLAGGVWKASGRFREAFERQLSKQVLDRQLVVAKIGRPPVYGAAALAKETIHGDRS